MATTLPLSDADAASTVFYDMDASIKDSNMEYLVRPLSVALLLACSLGFGCAKEGRAGALASRSVGELGDARLNLTP